jgi:hypothetical protein
VRSLINLALFKNEGKFYRKYCGFNELYMAVENNLLCEKLCEKNFPKSAKIDKNRKKRGKSYLTNSVSYNNSRRLGNPVALSSNP